MNERYAVPVQGKEIEIGGITPPWQEETLKQVADDTNRLLADLLNMIADIKNALYCILPEETPNTDKAQTCVMSGMICAREMVKTCCEEAMAILRGLKG